MGSLGNFHVSREPTDVLNVRVRGFLHARAHSFSQRHRHQPGATNVTITLIQQPNITRPIAAVDALAGRTATPALVIEGVTKRFTLGRKRKPVTAISEVSLRLERGDIHGILGANGSGKSTLIRLISGLLTLDEGRVEVFGHDLEREEMAVKRLINRVSVDAAFFKKLSPIENLLFAARLYGKDGGVAKREAVAILGRLGIGEKRVDRPVEQMSRGMQQKVAIARALLTSPSLLLLDEPTTGLDPRSKLDVQTFIEELRATHDATIVLTTHDLAEAERLCGRITVLDGGRVVAEDSPAGLVAAEARRTGASATLHDVFMTHTGRSLDDDVEEETEGESE
jgi:ABC-2 type transport system ATP-binding protein